VRFLITSSIKNNPPLRVLVVLFLIGSLLYWVAGWFFYHYKFGLTYEKMFVYFFTPHTVSASRCVSRRGGGSVYLLGAPLIYLRILLFILFQIGTGFMILYSLRVYLTGKRETAPEKSLLYAVVLFFALSTILFTLVSFFLFAVKVGLTPQSVSEYYLGNPQKFMKPKSLSLLLEAVA